MEGQLVAVLTETLKEAPWLGKVERIEGKNLSIVWIEGSYNSSWKPATICKRKKIVEWRDTVPVETVILSDITLTENNELTKDSVRLIKDTYSTYF